MEYRKTQQYLYGRKNPKKRRTMRPCSYLPGNKVTVRPKVIVRDLVTGEIKKVIPERKHTTPIRVPKQEKHNVWGSRKITTN